MQSSNLSLNKRRRTFVRLIGEIRNELAVALSEEAKSRRLTRAQIARILGKDKSAISKLLNGEANMTIESLADLAYALDRPVKISIPRRGSPLGTNYQLEKKLAPGVSSTLVEPKISYSAQAV